MPTYTSLTNSIFNNDALSTVGVINQTVSPNTNIMAAYTNVMATTTDMYGDNLYVLISSTI